MYRVIGKLVMKWLKRLRGDRSERNSATPTPHSEDQREPTETATPSAAQPESVSKGRPLPRTIELRGG